MELFVHADLRELACPVRRTLVALGALLVVIACGDAGGHRAATTTGGMSGTPAGGSISADSGGADSSGAPSGGTASGGAASGGAPSGGAPSGGTASGGAASGGAASGGAESGGATQGGAPSGGTASGGIPAGGAESGGAAQGGAASGGTAASCQGSDWEPGDQTLTLTHDGIERSYELHVPEAYTGTDPVPLLLVIHGAHNTPRMARSWSQMDAVADQNGFIVAYPAGLDCWNTGMILPGCTAADDDLGFILAVVDEIENHTCIDEKRVYATGISNGSMMAQYLGCEAAERFAAVGGVAAGMFGRCAPSRPISVFYVHGTADTTVGYSPGAVDTWIELNECDSSPIDAYSVGPTTCLLSQGCRDGVEVEFCTVEGMEHCWPDNCYQGSYGPDVFEASPMMWEFFSRHPLP